MASLLDLDRYGSTLLGLPGMDVQPPDDRQVSQADAMAQTWQGVMEAMARQRAISAERGLWEGGGLLEGGHPTQAGVMDALQQYGSVFEGGIKGGPRVSTRIPTGKGSIAAEIHAGNDLQIDTNAIRGTSAEPKVAERLREYPDVKGSLPGMDDATAIQNGIVHFKDNLRWLYDRVPPEVRELSGGWYDGAHKLTKELAERYGVPHEAVAAMTARLSPGTDWYQNMSMTNRALDIHHNQTGSLVSETQAGRIQSYIAAKKKEVERRALQGEFDGMAGRAYGQLDTDMQRALFIRSHDEALTLGNPENAYYNKIHPEGRELGLATLIDGVTPARMGWQSLDNIATSINMLRNPERSNISRGLGDAHKIRSFYNNIIDPNSKNGDVTIDTHAIAASHLLPLGIADDVVERGMSGPPGAAETGSKGLYGVYADAHRLLADELNAATPGLNILPRQVQSITWEAVRGLYPSAFKRSKTEGVGQAEIFRDMWSHAENAEAALLLIGARRGLANTADGPGRIPAPDWLESGP